MKQNIGELTEAELKARRFWNKKGFFGEPTKKLSNVVQRKCRSWLRQCKVAPPRRLGGLIQSLTTFTLV